MNRPQARAIAASRQIAMPALMAGMALLVLLLTALSARADDQEIIKAHGISTFGDLTYPADFAHLNYVNVDAPKGGEMSIWAQGTFDSMNPYSAKGLAGAMSSSMFESMLTGTADTIGESYGLLAESLEYPKDRSWVIFHMRPEARFSDGSPLTAEDAKFTYDIFLSEGLPSYRAILAESVDKAEVIDPHTIKYTFKTGIPTRDLIDLVGGLPVMEKAWFDKTGAKLDESRLDPAPGSGPYVLDHFDINERIVYKRNPDYWGNSLPINIGRNNFDTIRVEYFADGDAAFEGFKAGAYTFRSENSSKSWATAYDFPGVQNGSIVKTELPNGDIASGQAFVMNLRREKFQDIRVRQAIGLMFNFEWSNKTLFYGLYARINSFWENSALAATGTPPADELAVLEPLKDILPPGVLTDAPVMAPVSSDSQLDRGNMRKASALLDEAGWTVGDDGMRRNAKGETLKVEFLEYSPAFDRVINPYVENLKAIGVDASLSRVDSAQYTDRTRSFDFDIITDQLGQGYEPGAGLKQVFGTEGLNDVFNTPGLSDPAVDKLIEVIMAADTRDKLQVATRALDRVLRAKQFWVPQWYKNVYTVAYYDQYEHPDPLPPHALGNLDFWWFNAEKAAKLKASGALK